MRGEGHTAWCEEDALAYDVFYGDETDIAELDDDHIPF